MTLTTAVASAQDVFIVDTDTTVTNGDAANTVLDNDTLIVTGTGVIDVTGTPGDNAVEGTGDNITIEVRGALLSQGNGTDPGGNGIYVVGNDATIIVTETGTIMTTGDGGFGQFIDGTGGIMTNAGTIMTTGKESVGQLGFGGGNTIINSASIMTTGDGGVGQTGNGGGNRLTNSGTITTTGDDGYGQWGSGGGNTIINSASIMTMGDSGVGQWGSGGGNLLTNSGKIMTTDTSGYGQRGSGGENLLTNSGTIITMGNFGYGQWGGGGENILTNSGTIITMGDEAFGQWGRGSRNTLTNGGAITTEGDDAYGQFIRGNDGEITNAGSIVTHGKNAFGVRIDGAGNVAINRGAVTTTGVEGSGFYILGDGNTATNVGTIATSNRFGNGFYIIGNRNIVSNSGEIGTQGEDAEGFDIAQGDLNIITNSGRVVSRQAPAIRIGRGNNNTINLNAPAFVGGAIDFNGVTNTSVANTTVNIVTGPSHSIFWTLEGDMVGGAPNISGPVPWFYDAATQIVATFDPTLLASETTALGDLTALLSRTGLGALDSPDLTVGGNSPLAYQRGDDRRPEAVQATDRALQGDAITHRMGRVWATGLGGQMNHDGSDTTIDSTIEHVGFAAGYTWQHDTEVILNAMGGYVSGKAKGDAPWAQSFDHDTHAVFAGLGGEQELGHGAIQFGLTAGYQWVDHNRFVNDNLAPLGESWVTANYGGFFVSPELAVFTDIAMANGVTLTPNAGLRYAAQWLGGYSETGAVNPAANATVDARFVGVLEARAELEASRTYDFGVLSGRIGYLGRWNGGNDVAGITLNGSTQDVASGYQALNAVTVGATLRSDIGKAGFLELDASYLYGDTAHGAGGWLTAGRVF